MSFQFVNVSGQNLSLNLSGEQVCFCPPGFSGAVNLNGTVEVFKLGVELVTTNFLGANLSVSGGGTVLTNTDNQRVVVATGLATDPPFSFFAGSVNIANLYINDSYNLAYTYDGVAVNFVGSDASLEPNTISITDLTGGGITTNGNGSVLLGTFDAGGGTREVVAGVSALNVSTYAGHVEAFGWGLALGVVVFGYRWVCNVIGSIGREQDL
ncbi:MAG: hypothetical protein FD161_1741 [Limisphaerales bacterium]|nr:MAG: hypothetical protein FD161_1741 [Limisphaerales bacterium]KAG0509177.1 MAG: hypothetical protein E1N63_1660 [Limisphaerales bacterium]TXT52483.1 MAG: hypothetical protein FD140_707 [Limisphaerales bacterium]